MKNLLLTLLLLPIFSFSYEAPLAVRTNGVWSVLPNILQVCNSVRPQGSSLSYDTVFVDTVLSVIVVGDWSGGTKYTDRLLYQQIGDTLYTMTDIYTAVALTMCQSNDCCIVCKKTVDGKCSCYTDTCQGQGKCDERTYGTADIPAIGLSNSVRNYLQ